MRALLIIVIASVTLAAQTAAPQVTSQDLLDGLKDPTKLRRQLQRPPA